MVGRCSAAIFPFIVGCGMLLAVLVNYIIASRLGHVNPLWPYISDTGVHYPERNIFACLLDLTAFVGFPTLYIRNILIRNLTKYEQRRRHFKYISFAALCVGEIAVFGIILVGNFQENNPDPVHEIGAGLLFLGGTVYCILDTITTFQIYPRHTSNVIRIIRTLISIGAIIFAILFFTGKYESEEAWLKHFGNLPVDERRAMQMHWNETEPGYTLHVLGSSSEWAVGFMFILYFFTFAKEFRDYPLTIVFPDVENVREVVIEVGRANQVESADGNADYHDRGRLPGTSYQDRRLTPVPTEEQPLLHADRPGGRF